MDAIEHADRAVELYAAGRRGAALAESRFVLARALVGADVSDRRDEALELARQARAVHATGKGPAHANALTAVDAWLDQHG